jgi:hypothetical protein
MRLAGRNRKAQMAYNMKTITNPCNKPFETFFQRARLGLHALLGAALTISASAATVTVTVADDGVSNIGSSGTFYWAITNCNPGDTIAFNIPGAGPHYLQIPPDGFPLVYKKNNLVIDGYTQPGASPNTHSITQANNAVIKIVIDGRNGNARDMNYTGFGTTTPVDPPIDNTAMASEQGGYGDSELAHLGIYRSTNVTVRGLSFLGTFTTTSGGDQKGICFAHDYGLDTNVLDRLSYSAGSDAYGHVSGCWFGVDPANPTVAGVAGFLIGIAHYRHRDASGGTRPDLPNFGLTVGVAKGSTNANAEFNVFAGLGYAMDGENIRSRASGNFFGVLPDGVTAYNMTALNPNNFQGGQFEWGRYDDTEPMIIGTDGDGVNDAEEGNLFGPLALVGIQQPHHFDFYSTGRKPYIIAGNRFGIAVDGTRWTNSSFAIGSFDLSQGSQIRFGSDFNGVSDALEANLVYNNSIFSAEYTNPPNSLAPSLFAGMGSTSVQIDAWLSCRGNVFVDNFPTFNPDDSSASNYTNWWSTYVADTDTIIPALATNSTVSTLVGTCSAPSTNGYTNIIIDVYLPDPEGQINGARFDLPTFGGTNGWGFVQGKTYLGSFIDNGRYDSDPAVGSFKLNISSLGLPHGTKVTAAVTYSSFGIPQINHLSRSGTNTLLAWTGSNGGPLTSTNAGGPSSGFGLQRGSSLSGPWTTIYTPTNGISVPDGAGVAFYRVVAPGSGMTTLCAPPITLP